MFILHYTLLVLAYYLAIVALQFLYQCKFDRQHFISMSIWAFNMNVIIYKYKQKCTGCNRDLKVRTWNTEESDTIIAKNTMLIMDI
jgi:hypothetical protein